MNNVTLFKELMRFVLSRDNIKIKVFYLLITIIFYLKIRKKFVTNSSFSETSTGEVADDIYPLF